MPEHNCTERPHDCTRFFSKTVPEPNTGCLLWTAAADTDGYGHFAIAGTRRMAKAHRVAWSLVNGPIPAGIKVLHRCDTPACVNEDHLFLGTQRDNIADKHRKGRDAASRVTHCPQGHAYTPDNMVSRPTRRSRNCKECQRLYAQVRRAS